MPDVDFFGGNKKCTVYVLQILHGYDVSRGWLWLLIDFKYCVISTCCECYALIDLFNDLYHHQGARNGPQPWIRSSKLEKLWQIEALYYLREPRRDVKTKRCTMMYQCTTIFVGLFSVSSKYLTWMYCAVVAQGSCLAIFDLMTVFCILCIWQ